MKKFAIVSVLIWVVCIAAAEEWNIGADVSLILNQNAYSNNWNGSEKGSVSWSLNTEFSAEKQLNPKFHNRNTLQMAFGQTHSQYLNSEGKKRWGRPDKTTDEIDFESLLRLTLGGFVDPFASFRWESQFLDYGQDETKFVNPNILTETFGVAKMLVSEENRELSARLGAAFKQYFDDFQDANTNDGGVEFVGVYRSPFAQGVLRYRSKLTLYQAIYYSEADEVKGTDFEDDWKQVRMNWENTFTANLTRLVNVTLFFQAVYDKRQINEMQFKQTLGLGLTYNLF